MKNEVVVVGAGVSGLTCAVRLLEVGYGVRVIAAELPGTGPAPAAGKPPPEMCSKRAAAIWYPYHVQPLKKVAHWGNVSLACYRELTEVAGSGVKIVPLTLFFGDDPGPAEWALLEGCDRERLADGDLPADYAAGIRLQVPFIDTTVFLPFVEARVHALGGTLDRRPPFRSLAELRELAPVVVNCTGLGARDLCNDADVFPNRGQVLRVQAPAVTRWSVALPRGGGPVYVFPRSSDCILGGTSEPGEWTEQPEEATLARIQDACRALEPSLTAGYERVGEAAGLRPERTSGVRLEAEALGDGGAVIHNYGHGGGGFTVAWGCAEEVAGLVARQFGEPAPEPVCGPP